MPSIADLFISVSSDVSGAIGGLTSVDEKVNGTSAAMAAAAPAGYALAGAATAVGAGFVSAIGTAADFEQHMSGVKAVLNPNEVNTYGAALTDLALKLGKDTVFSADQAATAIEELVKAGVDVPTVLDGGAAAALNLASATGTDIVTAAGFAGTALNTFHESADQLTHTVDVLTGVANASAAGINDLKFAFAAVGPVASSLGLSFDDTATALGVFADNGLKGSDAGTSLKTMLLNLIPNTSNAVAAFRDLGLYSVNTDGAITLLTQTLQNAGEKGMAVLSNWLVTGEGNFDKLWDATKRLNPALVDGASNSGKWAQAMNLVNNAFFDGTGSAKSMADIFEILKTATADLSDEQKINALQMAFGTDAVRAATIAASEGADGFNKLSTQVQVTGLANTEAATRLDNLNGSLSQMGGSFETVQIVIGQQFLPVLRQAVDALTSVLNAFLTLDPGVQVTIVAIVGVVGAIAGLAAGFILLGPVIASVVGAFGVIGGVIAAAALPIVAIVAAVALLYEAWQTDFGGIREVTQQVWEAIQPALQNIKDFLSVLINNLGPAFSGSQSAMAPFISALSNDLAPILAKLPDLIRLIGDGFNALSGPAQAIVSIIQILATGNYNGGIFGLDQNSGIVQYFIALHDAIALFFDAVMRLLNGDFSGAWNSLWNAFTTVLQATLTAQVQLLELLGEAIVSFLQAIPGWIAQNVPGMWQALLDEFGQLPDQLAPYWAGFLGWLGGELSQLPGFIADAAGDVWAGLTAVFGALVPQLQPYWDNFAIWFGGVLGGIPQFVIDYAGDVFGGLVGIFGGLVDLLAPAWDVFAGWLAAVVGGIGQFVTDNMGDIWGGLIAAFFGLVDALAPAWDAFAAWLGGVLGGLPQFVADHIGDVWGALIAAFTGSTPGTTPTTPGGTPPPTPTTDPTLASSGTGPLVSIGTLIISSQDEANAFLDLVAQAVLASARRVSVPTAGGNPVLG